MDSYEASAGVINFLRESDSAFVNVNFFDVTSASTGATHEFANISAPAGGNSSHRLNLRSFCARDAIGGKATTLISG